MSVQTPNTILCKKCKINEKTYYTNIITYRALTCKWNNSPIFLYFSITSSGMRGDAADNCNLWGVPEGVCAGVPALDIISELNLPFSPPSMKL